MQITFRDQRSVETLTIRKKKNPDQQINIGQKKKRNFMENLDRCFKNKNRKKTVKAKTTIHRKERHITKEKI